MEKREMNMSDENFIELVGWIDTHMSDEEIMKEIEETEGEENIMSDAEKIISEIGELEEKVENREDEIRDMKSRIEDLNEILGVSNFDDDGMIKA